ncbi:hypothetical protein EAG_05759 [Camponotus floridanus]|uniref:Uncharacterized protein n=1 Tax=Camponotus floridanus TaxID=104421 RepID=E2AWQ1_CAMFO|nr:hypothetical protein EAG_05759 [Camponotus floridanus]
MDFQNVNPLNILLNAVSGNLLPMTTDNSSFSIVWKMYSALVWLLEITQMCVLIPGCFILPKEKTLKDGLIGIAVTMEVVYTVMRIHTRKALVQRLIQKLSNIMRVRDELMRSTVRETLKPIEIPLSFYWREGLVSIIMWTTAPFTLVFQKNSFVYMDYRMPVIFSKEPFSTSIFVFGSLVVMLSSMYIFTKKVSVDSYIINMILLITAQYKYIALKLSMIFQDVRLQSNCNSSNEKKDYPETNFCAKEKIKFICQHYNAVFQ